MTWYRQDDNMRNNKKFIRFSSRTKVRVSERDAARLYYMDLLAYCSHNLTDGFIPADIFEDLDPTGGKLAQLLSSNPLVLSDISPQYGAGWIIPDYLDWQSSRSEIEDKREREKLKKRRQRSAGKPPDGDPLSRGDNRGDTNGRPVGTERGTSDHGRSLVPTGLPTGVPPVVPRHTETKTKTTTSSWEGTLRNERERANAEVRPSQNGEVSKWAYDGPPEAFEVNWDNPRCTLHYKMPEGMRGDPCGMCAQLSRRARQKDATKGNGQSAAQLSRNGDDRRRRMAEIAREKFGDEALGLGPGQEFLGLRAIEGGRNGSSAAQ